ncbi:uncharacterized protein LOC122377666 [Amphibalanus amphitrite]|uniref:uncharacterized protein LOC122377666 n=1 Tax=Amphibalanus amphitrite TaxID=1232801 RepID=UPI001C8FC771|nr:uncharacterized protein LOC122377666 [Amphibalanus amphitrite]XP_043213907.1 uncharacterized protein LOC122377666 [Amphibalanus amphitrite]XP_043213908.1 uncharacterized protein LOC122377666 [Amphibalanus amphitrite]XP_043213909.1 uncharacterized protein LOC122377666 [Amphibalanus amphitrite]XP_043213910.1 uncharacterized protein LOC122377666 [Amphibalanus amphitrite]
MPNQKEDKGAVKKGTKRKSKDNSNAGPESKQSKESAASSSTVSRRKDGTLDFPDHPRFRPNRTPKEVLQAGSFGGTYFRPIKSGVTGESYKDVWKELPQDWLEGLNIKRQVASSIYDESVNKYGKKCGGSLEMWEQSGWIVKQDPYGWFQWYCRFYQGRRTEDDERQIGRWDRCAGEKGRWKNNLIGKVVRSGCAFDNPAVSPVVRQTLLHWGYELTEHDYKIGAKRVKK